MAREIIDDVLKKITSSITLEQYLYMNYKLEYDNRLFKGCAWVVELRDGYHYKCDGNKQVFGIIPDIYPKKIMKVVASIILNMNLYNIDWHGISCGIDRIYDPENNGDYIEDILNNIVDIFESISESDQIKLIYCSIKKHYHGKYTINDRVDIDDDEESDGEDPYISIQKKYISTTRSTYTGKMIRILTGYERRKYAISSPFIVDYFI